MDGWATEFESGHFSSTVIDTKRKKWQKGHNNIDGPDPFQEFEKLIPRSAGDGLKIMDNALSRIFGVVDILEDDAVSAIMGKLDH